MRAAGGQVRGLRHSPKHSLGKQKARAFLLRALFGV